MCQFYTSSVGSNLDLDLDVEFAFALLITVRERSLKAFICSER